MFRVLLPIDVDEERGLSTTKAIVSLPCPNDQISVTILNVQEQVEVSGGDGPRVSSEEWYDEEDYPKSVWNVKELLEDEGVSVTTRREHGDPTETIIEIANEIGADRIIMAGRKRSPIGKMLFGSVTQAVLLNADVAVTIAPAVKDQ